MVVEQVRNESAQSCLNQLNELDWGPIAYKLMNPESGKGWTQEQTKRGIARYLVFLTLKHLYPNVGIVPTQEIDRVWHAHILDTSKYATDCEQVFGYFLHHFPYMGMRGEADQQDLQDAFAQTQSLFEEHFGIPMAENTDSQAKAGFCIVQGQPQNTAKLSFCIVEGKPQNTAQPSFCIVEGKPQNTAQPSFCIVEGKPQNTAKPSFCIVQELAKAHRPQVEIDVDPVKVLEAAVV